MDDPGQKEDCICVGLSAESQAIGRYVAEKYNGQGTPLLGNTLKEKAIISKWVEVEGQNFSPPATAIVLEYVNSSTSKWPLNEELIATQVEKLRKVLDMYGSHLSKNRYLAASHYSLVNLFHAALLMQIKRLTGSL